MENKKNAPSSDNGFTRTNPLMHSDWSRVGGSDPPRANPPIGCGWAPICRDRTLSRVAFGSGDDMGRWNVDFRSMKEKRDEGKQTAPCSDNGCDWPRVGSDLSRANPVVSAFRLVEGGLRSVKIEPSREQCLGLVTVWEGGM